MHYFSNYCQYECVQSPGPKGREVLVLVPTPAILAYFTAVTKFFESLC